MVHGVVDGLRASGADATEVVVLTPLIEDDRLVGEEWDLRDYSAAAIVVACVLSVLRRLSGGVVKGTAAVRAMADADVVADVSGISFVDDRGGLTLAYNVLLLLPAMILGTPIVKVAQAMGPFGRPLNRSMARWTLKRTARVLTRGEHTHEMVSNLGVPARRADDVAFLMATSSDDRAWAARESGEQPYVVVSPSAVVVAQAQAAGVAYEELLVSLVGYLAETHRVLLLAHSARPGQPESKLNDVPLCERVLGRFDAQSPVKLVDPTGSPQQMREVIAGAELVVTSRFHSMISALAVSTPVVVVSWSHKYREVLREFGLEAAATDYRSSSAESISRLARQTLSSSAATRDTIGRHLPGVFSRARVNIDAILDARGIETS